MKRERDSSKTALDPFQHAVDILLHEIRVPIVAFRACVERLKHESQINGYSFKHNYFHEIDTYTNLMSRLVIQFEILRKGPSQITLHPERVLLFRDVIAPAVRHIQPLLIRKRLLTSQIEYSGMHNLPPVFVDPTLMIQVFFNLLENSVKYSQGLPEAFHVRITARRTAQLEILVEDHGLGVPDDSADKLFREGYRAQSARSQAPGDGLGLWVAAQILHRHNGEIALLHNQSPTIFVVRLPVSVQDLPPTHSY